MADMNKGAGVAIVVDDGSRRVPIRNLEGEEIGVFYFRPTDIGIIQRYNALAERFDEITEPLAGAEDDAGEASTSRQAEALAEAEKRLYDAVNALLGGDAAGAFFGRMNPFSPVNGEFYCESVLRAVGEYISGQFDTETARFSSRALEYARAADAGAGA